MPVPPAPRVMPDRRADQVEREPRQRPRQHRRERRAYAVEHQERPNLFTQRVPCGRVGEGVQLVQREASHPREPVEGVALHVAASFPIAFRIAHRSSAPASSPVSG